MKTKTFVVAFCSIIIVSCTSKKDSNTLVNIIGEMKNVMWKGQLEGTINLDTINNKEHLYGLGPVEYLSGEILIFDGIPYVSSVAKDSSVTMENTFNVKAPFFAHANITEWEEQLLPENIRTIAELENYLDEKTKDTPRPFMFKLKGQIDSAVVHIVNLPTGSKVSSPEEAHQGQVNYPLSNTEVDVLGFFSTEHQAIFTHHDTFLHMHLITADKKYMGHLDYLNLSQNGVILYLPKKN